MQATKSNPQNTMITLKFDNGEGGSYGFFFEDSAGEVSTVGPDAPTNEAWQKLNYTEADAIAELVSRGFDRSEILCAK